MVDQNILRVVVVDDLLLLRSGLHMILDDVADIKIVAEFENGQDFLQSYQRLRRISVVLMDVAMPFMSGLEILSKMNSLPKPPPVILLTMYPEKTYAQRAFEIGAKGYLTKDCSKELLIKAIRTVASGKVFNPDDTLTEFIQDSDGNPFDKQNQDDCCAPGKLSEREMEVFHYICDGLTSKEIAYRMKLSFKTVSTYKTRLMLKLKVDSLSELIRIGLSRNL